MRLRPEGLTGRDKAGGTRQALNRRRRERRSKPKGIPREGPSDGRGPGSGRQPTHRTRVTLGPAEKKSERVTQGDRVPSDQRCTVTDVSPGRSRKTLFLIGLFFFKDSFNGEQLIYVLYHTLIQVYF